MTKTVSTYLGDIVEGGLVVQGVEKLASFYNPTHFLI